MQPGLIARAQGIECGRSGFAAPAATKHPARSLARPAGGGDVRGVDGRRRHAGGRGAIAQALLNDPPVLLLDEPTAELDRDSEQRFVQTLKELAKDHTVIVVTHSPFLLTQCNGILAMNKGKLVAAGPAADMLPKLGMNVAK